MPIKMRIDLQKVIVTLTPLDMGQLVCFTELSMHEVVYINKNYEYSSIDVGTLNEVAIGCRNSKQVSSDLPTGL